MLASQLRRHGAFVALFVLASCVYFAPTWSDQFVSIDGDSSVYLLTARHYAPYLPADPVLAQVAANSPYPPLFPLLLVVSYGAVDLHLAHAAVTACLGSLVLFYAWLQSAGLTRGLAAVAVALLAIIPGTYIQATFILSESLNLLVAWPLMPLLIAYAFLGAAELAAILPTRLQGLRRGNPLVAWEAAEIHLGLVDGVRELSAGVPQGECVYSIKPAIVAQIGGRASYGPPAEALDDAAFERELAARGCRYFLLLASNSPTYRTPYYPQPRLADRLTLLDTRPHPNGSGAVLMALARFEPAR